MRIELEDSVFIAPDDHLELFALVRLGAQMRHWIVVDPPLSISEDLYALPENPPGFAAWIRRLPEELQDSTLHVFLNGVRRGVNIPTAKAIRVQSNANDVWESPVNRLSLPTAVALLTSPLKVMVENGTNDRNFAYAVAMHEDRLALEESESNHWIEFHHCGGSSMSQEISRLSLLRKHHVCAFFDSDALEPGQPSSEAREKAHLCKELLIPCRVLERRAIENYIPNRALWNWVSNNTTGKQRLDVAKAFSALSKAQKCHYNMRDGFRRARDQEYLLTSNNLFSGVSPPSIGALKDGFSTALTDIFHFPIHRPWLDEDDQRPETSALIGMILSHI